jgi:hypothetical protein
LLSFEVVVCYAARQLCQISALRSVYLNDLLRLLRRRSNGGPDIDVDVVAGVHHVGIHRGGGTKSGGGVKHGDCAGC